MSVEKLQLARTKYIISLTTPATPLFDAQLWRVFLCHKEPIIVEYKKPPLTHEQHLHLLLERGLRIHNKETTLNCLKHIGYYRLSAYFLPFKAGDVFKPNTQFETIIDLYTFDRKLRLLLLDAIESIEVSVRSQLVYHLSHTYDTFAHLDARCFSGGFDHRQWLVKLSNTLQKSIEPFIGHYKQKYISSPDLPLWMALEVISFGQLSQLFCKGLVGKDQQAIAKHYDVADVVLTSWMHVLVYTRNLCAHHARLWNRTLTVTPKCPGKLRLWDKKSSKNVYVSLAMMQYLLKIINPKSSWQEKLFSLLQEHPQVSIKLMGFPENWKDTNLWK